MLAECKSCGNRLSYNHAQICSGFSVDEAVRSGDIRRANDSLEHVASVVKVEAPVASVGKKAHAPWRAHIVAQRTMW